MDGRINNGGHSTKGVAGRKPKADELKLIEKLSPLEDKAYEALKKLIDKGNINAVKLWFEYMYGKPREKVSMDISADSIPLAQWVKQDEK